MNTSRREFLQTAGKGLLLTAALPLINACGTIGRESNISEFEPIMTNKLMKKDHFEILRYASLAPSGHNAQPWEVDIIEPGRWIIKSNPDRWLPAVDPENREGTLSIGPFIENLVLAAGSFGYSADVAYLASSLKDKAVAEVTLVKDRRIEYPLNKIESRRTVRSNHLQKSITSDDLKFISGSNNSNIFYFPAGSKEGKFLADGTLEANKIQTFRENAQSELADWIRFSSSDAEKYRNGLTPSSMEMSGFASLFVRLFYDKSNVMSQSFREKGIGIIEEQLKSYGGWIVITCDGSDPKNIIEAGRIFQRMALKTREKLIALHPMTQLLEEGFGKKVQTGLSISEPIQFIVRASYVDDYPDPVSLRRPVEWFTA